MPLFLLLNISAYLIHAQTCPMQIGTNLDIIGSCGVHKDLKLSSTHFFTRNAIYIGDDNDWDSGLAETMAQDDAGYPLEIPFPHPVNGNDQVVAFTVGGYSTNYETGNYILLYDGDGDFEFANWTSQTVTSVAPGRIEFTIDEVNENGVHIELISSTLGNHVHNIRVIQDIYESNYLTDPFLPQFFEKADQFLNFRFMDWTYTNNNIVDDWDDRTQRDFHTQEQYLKGCSWELAIEMCNYFQKDIWINIPHLADSAYIDSLAFLFKNNLDPGLHIYLEYSNECWNWIFEQTYWLDSAPPFPTNFGRNYGYYSNRVFTLWENIFSGEETRLKTVLAGHDYFVIDGMNYMIEQGTDDLVDLVSYPGYVALNEDNYDTLSLYGTASTAEMVLEMLNENMATDFFWMKQFKELVADAFNKEFVMYEGGQHITPEWFGLDTTYNQALYDAQIHPGMYSFYHEMLNYYKDTLDISLFVNYTLSSPQESSFGSWGLLDNNFMTAPWPPKYQAILDFINNCGNITATEIELETDGINLFPNPSPGYLYITGELNNYHIHILDLNGNIHQEISTNANAANINIDYLPAGIYFISVENKTHNELILKKIIKL